MLAARVGEIEEALREGARREAELKLKLERGAEDAAAKEKAAAAAGLIADQQVELAEAYRLAAVGKADGALAFGGVAALAHALAAWRRAWLEGAAERGSGTGCQRTAGRRWHRRVGAQGDASGLALAESRAAKVADARRGARRDRRAPRALARPPGRVAEPAPRGGGRAHTAKVASHLILFV